MTIRILNCGSKYPLFPKIEGGITCLLVETNQGPVLVDTGFGINDYLHPGRVVKIFTAMMRSPRDVNETAYHQVQQLGCQPRDIRHIVMTHLHFDHAGGLPDFPHATVHIYQPECEYVTRDHPNWVYMKAHWAHGPKWQPYTLRGEKWYEFDAIRLSLFQPELWLVPLTGHSPGHSGVAIREGKKWVFLAGDAVPFNLEMEIVPDWISRPFIGPHVPKIREFMRTHPEVQVVGNHMTVDFYKSTS